MARDANDTQEAFATFQVYEGLMVHVEFGSRTPTLEEFNSQFLDLLQQMLDHGQPFTMFCDASKLGTVPMSIAFTVVKWMKNNRAKIRGTMKASAIIVGSEFVSGLLDWVFTLSPPVSPNIVVRDPSEGLRFIETHMDRVSPALVGLS